MQLPDKTDNTNISLTIYVYCILVYNIYLVFYIYIVLLELPWDPPNSVLTPYKSL